MRLYVYIQKIMLDAWAGYIGRFDSVEYLPTVPTPLICQAGVDRLPICCTCALPNRFVVRRKKLSRQYFCISRLSFPPKPFTSGKVHVLCTKQYSRLPTRIQTPTLVSRLPLVQQILYLSQTLACRLVAVAQFTCTVVQSSPDTRQIQYPSAANPWSCGKICRVGIDILQRVFMSLGSSVALFQIGRIQLPDKSPIFWLPPKFIWESV